MPVALFVALRYLGVSRKHSSPGTVSTLTLRFARDGRYEAFYRCMTNTDGGQETSSTF